MQPDIIVTAPLPPFLYDPLKATTAATTTRRRPTRPALLAAEGAKIRGLVQGGGTVTPTHAARRAAALEIISVFGVGYDGVPVDYCKERGLKVTNTPDVLTDDVADVARRAHDDDGSRLRAAQPLRARGRMAESAGPSSTTKLAGKTVGHPGTRPHRQGDRAARLAAMG